jgi:hypothetical protein
MSRGALSKSRGSLHGLFAAHWDLEHGRDELPLVLADRQVGPTKFIERFVT